MILGYSFIGLLLASIGGAAPGASNIAVLKKTTNHSLKKGMQIALGAGVGEVILAFLALCYSNFITHFFEMNMWAQILFSLLFFLLGIAFVFSENLKQKGNISIHNSFKNIGFIKGFFLSLVNPPVLLFWILGISLTQKYLLPLTDMSPIFILVLFFAGVFLGKVGILYGYARLGKGLNTNKKSNPSKMNTLIGIVFIMIASIQILKIVI